MENHQTNEHFYQILRNSGLGLKAYEILLQEILNKFSNKKLSKDQKNDLTCRLRKFCSKLSRKWENAYRSAAIFELQNESWLKQPFYFPSYLEEESSGEEDHLKSFTLCSDRHNARRTEPMRSQYTGEELLYGAKLKLREEGHINLSKILNFLIENPNKIERFLSYIENEPQEAATYSPEKGLSVMTSLDLSKYQYNFLRAVTGEGKCHLFPSYYKIQSAKAMCYPDKEAIKINEKEAQINIQHLLDHTTSRILKSIGFSNENPVNLTLIGKWGCDGSSDQSLYKQAFSKQTNFEWDDSSIFVTSYVPLRLSHSSDKSNIIWENKKPSSTSLCRPIRFAFCKETPEIIREEVNRVEAQLSLLEPTSVGAIKVKHNLIMTMVDGKICNVITQTSSAMRCYICSTGPKDMNNLDNLKQKTPNEDFYNFGLSPLHAKIRFLECILHISYNLGFKKWTAKSPEEKNMQSTFRLNIKRKFREQLGLLVDEVRQGKGTSNDGNTARKFFQNPHISAEITGVDEKLIYRLSVILQVISSGNEINVAKFDSYATETAQLYVSLYPWYFMPATVHKVLIHGSEVIQKVLIPIGQLSEEAQEARHKEFRKFRLNKSRKINREATNEDILHNLLITSDPFISNIRSRWTQKNDLKLFPEAIDILNLDLHPTEGTSQNVDVEMDSE